MSKGRVLVAMSGGVDSSVTAYLLKQQGYECVGVTMRLTCPAPDPATGISKVDRDIADAKAVAARIGIPHRVLDLQETLRRASSIVSLPLIRRDSRPTRASSAIDALNLERYSTPRSTWIATISPRAILQKLDQAPDGTWQLHRGEEAPKRTRSYFLYSLTQERLGSHDLSAGGHE